MAETNLEEKQKNCSSPDFPAAAGAVEETVYDEVGEDQRNKMPAMNEGEERKMPPDNDEDNEEGNQMPAVDEEEDDEEELKMPPAYKEDNEEDEDEDEQIPPSSPARAHPELTPNMDLTPKQRSPRKMNATQRGYKRMWQSPKAHLLPIEERQEQRQGNQMEQQNPRKLVIRPKGNKYWIPTTLLLWPQQAITSAPKKTAKRKPSFFWPLIRRSLIRWS